MFKIMGLVTGALAMAALMLAMTGVPQVAGVDWQAVSGESIVPVGGEPASVSRVDQVSTVGDVDSDPSVDTIAAGSIPLESQSEAVDPRDVVSASVEPPDAEIASVETADTVPPAVLAARLAIEQAAAARARFEETQAAALIVSDTELPGEPLVDADGTDRVKGNAMDESTREPGGIAEEALAGDPLADGDDFAVDVDPSVTPDSPSGWQPVWAPFRSELSARGFMGRLERLTDLRYRISEIGPGLYQVAFAHAGFEERVTGIAAIEGATGLDLARKYP